MAAIRTFPDTMNIAPGALWSPRALMNNLFTQEEKIKFASSPQGLIFMTFIASTPTVDITNPEFVDDIKMAVEGGLLTQERADQVLAGEVPTSS